MKKILVSVITVLALTACGQKGTSEVSNTEAASSSSNSSSDARKFTNSYVVQAKLESAVAKVPNCPAGALCEIATEITFSFQLGSCIDKLANVLYTEKYEGSKHVFEISGIALTSPEARLVRCVAPQIERKTTVQFGIVSKDSIEVRPLSSMGN